MMTSLLRHLLPPEDAHKFALWGLKHGFGPSIEHKADLSFTFLGKRVTNPIGLAAGADKKAEALSGWWKMGFGIVEVGTITMNPRQGNPKPRVWRFPEENSLVNFMGLPGPGYEEVIQNLKNFKYKPERRHMLIGASIASPEGNLGDFSELARLCNPYVDYITLNGSCPNVDHGNETAQTIVDQIKATKQGARNKPVLLKLAPAKDKKALQYTVNQALEAGVDGFVATNTLPPASNNLAPALAFDWPEKDGKKVGGYSGPDLLPVSTFMVATIRDIVGPNKPIIGVGGVQSSEDALALMKAGADAIQLYTGLIYKGPSLIRDIGKKFASL